ncbi:chromosome partitioning protein ParA [Aeromonas caviae]|uniref:Chromosome partitioning protein ParA n=1 Tax=Aeromonas caviae TaxID=648 RepID=A0AA37CY88_AERCA|nr:chromosome partitioning protein ParA [Aeromonas caviae]
MVVAHSKGGTGKTTAAVQLAGEMGITTLVDLDRHLCLATMNELRPDDMKWRLHSNVTGEQLAALIESDQDLLIDCGGYDSNLTRAAIAYSDIVICPANDDITELRGLVAFNDTLAEIEREYDLEQPLMGHVLTAKTHPSRRDFSRLTDAVASLPHLTMLTSKLSRRNDFGIMMDAGLGVTERTATAHSEAGKEVKALATEVMGILNS